ncbi:MAG: efflux RND transporter periplasmic adaptor subunit, partial [Gammaproteobacteria bacterium]
MRSFLLILLLAAIAAGIAWTVSRPKPVAVIAVPIAKGRVEATVSNTRVGTVKACRRSRLAPATGGQVAQLPVQEGDRVAKDDLLMVIWNEDLAAQVQLAKTEAAAADARSRAACLTADVAEREA